MDSNTERLERYLRGVEAAQPACDLHRQQLRQQVIAEVGRSKRPTSITGAVWKMAAAVVLLACLGGIVGAVVQMKYRFTGQRADGSYGFVDKDSKHAYTIDSDANGAMNVDQTANDLAEIDLLRKQRAMELVGVVESEVGGRLDSRTYLYQYTLSGGRTKTIGEGDPDDHNQTPLTRLSHTTWMELDRLRKSGKAESLGQLEKPIRGRPFVFKREQLTLQDGTRVVLTSGKPKDAKEKP